MTADELSAPLGQTPRRRRRKFPIAVPHVIAGHIMEVGGQKLFVEELGWDRHSATLSITVGMPNGRVDPSGFGISTRSTAFGW